MYLRGNDWGHSLTYNFSFGELKFHVRMILRGGWCGGGRGNCRLNFRLLFLLFAGLLGLFVAAFLSADEIHKFAATSSLLVERLFESLFLESEDEYDGHEDPAQNRSGARYQRCVQIHPAKQNRRNAKLASVLQDVLKNPSRTP